jgi:hypothetical protein
MTSPFMVLPSRDGPKALPEAIIIKATATALTAVAARKTALNAAQATK